MIFASGKKGDIAGQYIIMENEVITVYSLVLIKSEDKLLG